MQGSQGQKEVLEEVRRSISPVLKLVSVKMHDFVFRKSLTSVGGVFHCFPLMRVRVTWRKGRSCTSMNRIVYPGDLVPYGRMTLGVMERIARRRWEDRFSRKDLADEFYSLHGLSFSRIRGALARAVVGFERLVTAAMVPPRGIAGWLRGERREFAVLNREYWKMSRQLSPPFHCLF